MRYFFVLFATLLATQASAQFQQHFTANTFVKPVPAIDFWFMNTANGVGIDPNVDDIAAGAFSDIPEVPEDTMTYFDVVDLGLPADTVAVSMTGRMLISHDASGMCVIYLAVDGLKGYDTQWGRHAPHGYIGQAVSANRGDGRRSGVSFIAPVMGGLIGIKWYRTGGCSMGINLVIDGYWR